jgi:hypothetical protein
MERERQIKDRSSDKIARTIWDASLPIFISDLIFNGSQLMNILDEDVQSRLLGYTAV